MKKYSIIILLNVLMLSGCSTSYMGYDFRMIKPSDNASLVYSDEFLDIAFKPSRTTYWGVEGLKNYENFNGISFLLQNKTDEVIVIDWNRVLFKGYYVLSENNVMHEGIKYKDCLSVQRPSSIPPKGKFRDTIIPCYAVEFSSGKYGRGWEVHMLPSPLRMPTVEFGVFMPIQIGDNVINYQFDFRGKRVERQW